jgi:uncharacterized membrane protein
MVWFWQKGKIQAEHENSVIFSVMLGAGIVGLAAALALGIERYIQLTNPGAVLVCDVNAILNCGIVMQTWQAKLFGFPNSFIGLMTYPVVITVAVAGLAGAKFPRWFWLAAQAGFGLGLIFAYWLFFQSVFVIQVLCPLCLGVTVVTTVLFESLLRYNLRENTFKLSKSTHKKVLRFLQAKYDVVIAAAWLAAMIALVLVRFPGIV